MNPRQRFLRTLGPGSPDRPPYHDREIPEEVVVRWRQEGLPAEASVEQYFGLDHWELIGPREQPRFDIAAAPEYRGPLQSAADFCRLERAYDATTPGRYPRDWDELVKRWHERDFPVGITVWRGMLLTLGVHDWNSLRDVMYGLHDFPEQLEAVMDHVAEFTLAVMDRALREVQFDYAVLAEPIASWHAPIVGPDVCRRFVVPTLRRLVDRLLAANVGIIVWDAHGRITPLLPCALEAGANTLWLGSGRAAGVSYVELRQAYGPELGLIGGLDARVLDQGPRAIEQEIRALAPTLLEEGRYVPMVDERIRAPVTFDPYASYRKLVRELAEKG